MARYKAQGPDGVVHEMEGPDNASDSDILKAFQDAFPSKSSKPEGFSPVRALLTNEPTSGFAESTLRGAPASLAGMAGFALGLPTMGAASIPAAGLLGAGAEGLRQMGVQGYAMAMGKDVSRAGEVLGSMGGEGALQGVFQGLGVGGKALAATPKGQLIKSAIGDLGKEAITKAASLIGGVSESTQKLLRSRASKIMSLVNRDPEVMQEQLAQAGHGIRDSIGAVVKATQDAYEAVVDDTLTNAKQMSSASYGVKWNLFEGLGDKLSRITKKYGLETGVLPGVDDAASTAWSKINLGIQNMDGVGIEKIHSLKNLLSRINRDNPGTALGAAAKETRNDLIDFISKDFPELKDIQGVYRMGKELEESASKIVGAENLPGRVSTARKLKTTVNDDINKTIKLSDNIKNKLEQMAQTYGAKTGEQPGQVFAGSPATEKLSQMASKFPSVSEAYTGLSDITAAKEVSPLIASLPRTGLAGGLLYGASSNPIGLAAGAVSAPFLSPRLIGLGYQYAPKYVPVATNAISRVAGPAVRPVATGIADYYMLNRQVP